MRVLVTGGAGFIGSHVSELLLNEGHEVAVIDNLSSGVAANLSTSIELLHADIKDQAAVRQAFRRLRPHVVVHLAAQKSVTVSVSQPLLDASDNILGSLTVLEAAREFGTSRIVFASTGGAVYGETNQIPTSEIHPTRPESPYGVSKLAVEHYMRVYEETFGLTTVCLRMANVFGPRQDPFGEAGVAAIFCERALSGLPLIVFGDGRQTRDYVYVKDAAKAFLFSLDSRESGVFNIGTATEASVLELVQTLSETSGLVLDVQHQKPRQGELQRSCLSYDRASRVLGWKPETSLRSGVESTFRWFESQPLKVLS